VAHDLDAGEPVGGLATQPGDDVGLGSALGMPEDALISGQVGEPGVPAIGQLCRGAGVGIGAPAGFAPADLVDAQHPDRRWRLVEDRVDLLDECGMGGMPGNPVGGGDLGDVSALLGDRGRQTPAQPRRDPLPGRHRERVLGERAPPARRCRAPPPPLGPHQGH
jgi:hypothetical protein